MGEVSFYQNLLGTSEQTMVRNKYDYDHLGRFIGNMRYVNGTQTDIGTEKDIMYDLNGNLEFVRRNVDGTSVEYGFVYNGNTLELIYRDPFSDMVEMQFVSDENGNLIQNGHDGVNMSYNFLNLPSMVNALTYKYLSDGTKLSVKKSDGASIVYRGSFVYDVSAQNVVTLESVGIPEGRVYCSDTPDERNWECWDVKDYLGNVRAVVRSDNGSPIEINDYLPYGTRIEEYTTPYQVGNNRWRYAGKESQQFGGYDEVNLIDFGSRYFSLGLGRWTTLDPQAWKYTSSSPYNYCNNNPVNFVDPNGEAWGHIEYNDGSFIIFWIDNEYVTDSKGNLYPGFYDSMVAFVPGKEFDPGKEYNIGSSIAIVCDIEGDISFFDACTYPSDLEKYPTVPEGSYEAMKGMHKNKYPALKMFDIGKDLSNNTIELGFVNPAYTDGRTYISGANIHMAGIKNATTAVDGTPIVSQACLLIDRNRWDEFMSHFDKLPNSSKIGIIVRRLVYYNFRKNNQIIY